MREARAWARLLLRGLRWRWTSGVVLLAVGVVAVAAAAVGPTVLRAATASTIETTVADAPVASTALGVLTSGGTASYDGVVAAVTHRGPLTRWTEAPSLSVVAGIHLAGRGTVYQSQLLWRTGECGHLRFASGHCPTATDQVALSTRTASALGLRPGPLLVGAGRSPAALHLQVVGLYQTPAIDPTGYWSDPSDFSFGAQAPNKPPQADALVTTTATALSATALGTQPQEMATVALRDGAFRSGGAAAFEAALAGWEASIGRIDGLSVSTSVGPVLAAAAHSTSLMGTVADGFVVELVLLALLVVYQVVSTGSRDRRLEADLARRRGFTRRALLVVAVGEPVAVLLVGFPIGMLAAWVVVEAAARTLFAPGTPVSVPAAAWLAGVGAVVGGLVAVVVATWDLWRGASRGRAQQAGRLAVSAATDAFAVALAAAGLFALSSAGALDGSRTDPVAVAAPALMALGAGVLGLRLVALLVRVAVAATRDSSHLSVYLAVRSVARRRPDVLRQLLGLTAAVALAAFAVSAWSLAAANRRSVAGFQVGADRILDVSVRSGVTLLGAVDRADPSGRSAMAAVLDQSSDGNLLAVDSSRLARVTSWPAGVVAGGVTRVARLLDPPHAPPILVSGSTLEATIDLATPGVVVDLSTTVYNLAGGNELTLSFGRLQPGTHRYQADIAGFCASTCRLVDLVPVGAATPRLPPTTSIDLLAMSTTGPGGSHPVDVGAGRSGSWRVGPSPATEVSGPGRPGVGFRLPTDLLPSGGVTIEPDDEPAVLPVVATPQVLAASVPTPPAETFAVAGLDGQIVNVSAAATASTLPEIGNDATLVDLDLAQLAETGTGAGTPQVWLSPSAGPALLARLHQDGLTVVSEQTARAARVAAGRGALALAYRMVVVSGPAAILLALVATVFGVVATGRRRRRDLDALVIVGVPRAAAVRAALLETGLVLAVAWVLGGAIGWASSRLALGSLPQFVDGTGGIPFSRQLPAVPFALTLAGVAVLFVACAVVTTRAVLRRPEAATTDG